MKKLWFLMIVILAAFSLFISACGDDDDDDNIDITNPDDADWVLAFFQLPDNLRSGFMFEAWWNGESTAITEADVFTLEVGGTSIPVESYFYANEWIISGYDFPLNTGTTYEVKFYKNGNLIVSKNVKTCYPASCDFPATYNPTQATTLNWTVPENNHTQFISVSSNNSTYTDFDEELFQVSNSTRSYTIPANSVQGFGAGTDYELAVMEYNNYVSGTTYITLNQGVGATYEAMLKAKLQRLERARNQAL